MSETRKHDAVEHLRDLGFTVFATAFDTHVLFDVYDDDTGRLKSLGLPSYDPPVRGVVKWDGCSDWNFNGGLHCCSLAGVKGVGAVMEYCWDMASQMIPNFQGKK